MYLAGHKFRVRGKRHPEFNYVINSGSKTNLYITYRQHYEIHLQELQRCTVVVLIKKKQSV